MFPVGDTFSLLSKVIDPLLTYLWSATGNPITIGNIGDINPLPKVALMGGLAGGMWLSRWAKAEAQACAEVDVAKRVAELQEREAYYQVLMDVVVAESRRMQEKMEHDAHHDALTNLLNRQGLLQCLDHKLTQAHQTQSYQYAVLFIDLKRFHRINNSMGYAVGDQLLVAIAQMLRACVKGVDSVARLSADEFAILIESVEPQELMALIQAIIQSSHSPFLIAGQEIAVNLSIGVVTGTPRYYQAADVIRNAGIAMHQARQSSSNLAFFNPTMRTQATHQLAVETELRRAIASEELCVHYQPIVNLKRQTLAGFEALVRWQHPTQLMMGPETFIGIAEESGLINRLDQWVFYRACGQLAAWIRQYSAAKNLTMSVNLSVRDLHRPQLLADIDATLAKTGLAGHSIVIEITETLLIEDEPRMIERLHQLTERGIRLAIDDFGTGYSSLSYLNQLPAHHVKIDKTFVDQMHVAHHHRQVVDAVVNLSHQLSMITVAEGIETRAQMQTLQALGCDLGQGYLFSKPLSAEAIETRFFSHGRAGSRHAAEVSIK